MRKINVIRVDIFYRLVPQLTPIWCTLLVACDVGMEGFSETYFLLSGYIEPEKNYFAKKCDGWSLDK